MREISRRTLLAAAGLGGASALAGCDAFRDDEEPRPRSRNESADPSPGAVVWKDSDGTSHAQYRNGESVTGDDAAEVLQSTLDSVTDEGSRPSVVEVEGTFDLSDSIDVPGQAILDLMGAKLVANGDYAPVLLDDVSDVTLVGGVLDGAGQTDEQEFLGVVSMNRAERVTIAGTEAVNGGYYGVNLYECNDCLLYGVRARDNYRVGIHPGTDSRGWGVGNVLTNCVAEGNQVDGINDRGATVSGVDPGNTYLNCLSRDNGRNGIVLGNGVTEENPSTTHHAVACRSIANGETGVVIGRSRAVVAGLTARDNGMSGVQINGGRDVSILNPSITNNTAPDQAGIKIVGNDGLSPSDIVVYGGHVRNNWVNLLATSGIPIIGVTYRDVDARGSRSQNVAFYGDGEKRDITVENVRGYRTRNRGQVTRRSGGGSFEWEHGLAGTPAAVNVQAANAAATGEYYVEANDRTISVTYPNSSGDGGGEDGGNELRWWWRADLY